MIGGGFLSPEDRASLSRLARDRSAAHRLARRANALLLLDKGWSCVEVAEALLQKDDTEKFPKRWPEFRSSVTDSFRVIDPKEFRVLA
jgi:hypothetical protein